MLDKIPVCKVIDDSSCCAWFMNSCKCFDIKGRDKQKPCKEKSRNGNTCSCTDDNSGPLFYKNKKCLEKCHNK